MRMKRLILSLGLVALAACSVNPKPKPPGPTPTPTPEPPPVSAIKYPELELRTDGVSLTRGGLPFLAFGAVQCCMDAPEGENWRWPLASASWMDYTKANLFHFRIMSWYGDAEHESAWADVGGPYLGNGPDFNPAFWNSVVELTNDAGKRKANVEVALDTWYCKTCQWGTQPCAWPQEDIDACGRRPSAGQERLIRKYVSEVGCFANVIWLTDNEGGEIQGTKREWYDWVRNVIRDEEQKTGCGVVHLIGTNNTDFCDGPFDYCVTHDRNALLEPIAGKHSANNERNPGFSVDEEFSNFKRARDRGLNYWYWRAEQKKPEMDQTLALFRGEGSVVPGCFAPPAEDPKWVVPPQAGSVGDSMKPQVDAAKAAVGDRCGFIGPCEGGPGEPEGHHCQQNVTLGLIAAELRKQNLCASGPWADAVAVRNPQGLWQEFHAVAFGTGCMSTDPGQNPKNTWSYGGTAPAPGPSPSPTCSVDVPTVDEIACKLHQATNHIYDCTPKANGRPILLEGNPERDACEAKSCGGTPTFSITQPEQSLTLVSPWRDNPYQFQLKGSGTAQVHCTCPAAGARDLCNSTAFTQ
jgi:hypothetical protein